MITSRTRPSMAAGTSADKAAASPVSAFKVGMMTEIMRLLKCAQCGLSAEKTHKQTHKSEMFLICSIEYGNQGNTACCQSDAAMPHSVDIVPCPNLRRRTGLPMNRRLSSAASAG